MNFTNLRHKLRNHSFIRNVATLLAGNMSAQVVAMLTAPVITRIFTPEHFGIMTLLWSYVGILSIAACLRYESAIVIEKDGNNAIHMMVLCLVLTIVLSCVLLVAVPFYNHIAERFTNTPEIIPFLWFIPIGVAATAIFNTLSYWHTRMKNFSLLAGSRVLVALATASVKIFSALMLGSSAFWLLAGNTLGFICGIGILTFVLLKQPLKKLCPELKRERFIPLAHKYSQFPKYHVWTGLLNSTSQNLPILLFAYYFSAEIVGFYGLANSILRRPITVMSQSLSKVFLQKASEIHAQQKSLHGQLAKTTLGLTAIGAFPFGLLLFFGKDIFSFVFGAEWSTAGFYTQLLTPWLFMGFINPPSTQILVVLQKLKFNFYYNIINVALRSAVIITISLLFKSPWKTIACFSAVGFIANWYYLWFAFAQAKKHFPPAKNTSNLNP